MNRNLKRWGGVFGLVGMLAVIAAVAAPRAAHALSAAEEAESFIAELASTAVDMVEKSGQSDAEREAEFRRIVRKGFALDVIGQFVVGRYWRQMSTDQRKEYQDLFAEWLMKSYAGRLGGYQGQTLEVVKSLEAGSRDVFVRTRVLRPDGQPPIAADWRVRKFDDQYRIIDVVVEGVSMAAAQKSEFESVIREVGIEGLIESLRQRLAVLLADTG